MSIKFPLKIAIQVHLSNESTSVILNGTLYSCSNGWIDFWSIPIAALSINYMYHPMPPFGPPPQADITTPEKEEILLSPMRMTSARKNPPVLQLSKVIAQYLSKIFSKFEILTLYFYFRINLRNLILQHWLLIK